MSSPNYDLLTNIKRLLTNHARLLERHLYLKERLTSIQHQILSEPLDDPNTLTNQEKEPLDAALPNIENEFTDRF